MQTASHEVLSCCVCTARLAFICCEPAELRNLSPTTNALLNLRQASILCEVFSSSEKSQKHNQVGSFSYITHSLILKWRRK